MRPERSIIMGYENYYMIMYSYFFKQWDALRIYVKGGHLQEEIRSFYKDVSAFVHMKGELSESFHVGVGVRWVCDVT